MVGNRVFFHVLFIFFIWFNCLAEDGAVSSSGEAAAAQQQGRAFAPQGELSHRVIIVNDWTGSDISQSGEGQIDVGILGKMLTWGLIQEAAPILITRKLFVNYLGKLIDVYDDFPQLDAAIGPYKLAMKTAGFWQNFGLVASFEAKIKRLPTKNKNDPFYSYVYAQVPLNSEHWYLFDYPGTEYVLLVPRIFEKKLKKSKHDLLRNLGFNPGEHIILPQAQKPSERLNSEVKRIQDRLKDLDKRFRAPIIEEYREQKARGLLNAPVKKVTKDEFFHERELQEFLKIFRKASDAPFTLEEAAGSAAAAGSSSSITVPWNIYLIGHGKTNIAGLSSHDFTRLLYFFNRYVPTNFLLYVTCYGGKYEHLTDPYRRLKNPNYPLHYIIGSVGTADTPVNVVFYKDEPWLSIQKEDQEIFSPPMPVDFNNYFELLEKHKPFDDVLRTVASPSNFRYGYPVIRFPGTNWFSAVDIDHKILILTRVKSLASLVEKKEIEIKNKEAVLLYESFVGAPVAIKKSPQDLYNNARMIIMSPPDYKNVSRQYFAQITLEQNLQEFLFHNLSPRNQKFSTRREFYIKKMILKQPMTCIDHESMKPFECPAEIDRNGFQTFKNVVFVFPAEGTEPHGVSSYILIDGHNVYFKEGSALYEAVFNVREERPEIKLWFDFFEERIRIQNEKANTLRLLNEKRKKMQKKVQSDFYPSLLFSRDFQLTNERFIRLVADSLVLWRFLISAVIHLKPYEKYLESENMQDKNYFHGIKKQLQQLTERLENDITDFWISLHPRLSVEEMVQGNDLYIPQSVTCLLKNIERGFSILQQQEKAEEVTKEIINCYQWIVHDLKRAAEDKENDVSNLLEQIEAAQERYYADIGAWIDKQTTFNNWMRSRYSKTS